MDIAIKKVLHSALVVVGAVEEQFGQIQMISEINYTTLNV